MSNREQQEDQKEADGAKGIKKKNHHKHKAKKKTSSASASAEESASSSSSGAASPSCTCGKAAEYGCSCCLCCVYCPLSVVWCCVKLPCKVGIRAAQAAKRHSGSCWSCGRKKPPYYYSSSFSDLEFSPP
ncbi:hypothetical protein LINGRAHAP2_LOCUS11611 [Linum grandiflorum]